MNNFPYGIAFGVEQVQAQVQEAHDAQKWTTPATMPDQFEATYGPTWVKLYSRAEIGDELDKLRFIKAVSDMSQQITNLEDVLTYLRMELGLPETANSAAILGAVRKLKGVQ